LLIGQEVTSFFQVTYVDEYESHQKPKREGDVVEKERKCYDLNHCFFAKKQTKTCNSIFPRPLLSVITTLCKFEM